MGSYREYTLEKKVDQLNSIISEQQDRIAELETMISEMENNFAIMQSLQYGGDCSGIRVFGMTLEEVRAMMKRNKELELLARDMYEFLNSDYPRTISSKFEERLNELWVLVK